MQLHPAQITNFSGGLNTGAPLVGFPATQFPFALNADALVNGRLARRLGTRRTHLSRLGSGASITTAATAWWPEEVIQRVVIYFDTAYYSDDGGVTWNVAATGALVSPSSTWQFVTVRVSGTNWLYAAPGSVVNNEVVRWDGAVGGPGTWEDAPGVPTSPGPQHLAVFGGRLYVAGHAGPLVQASAIGNPEDFTVPNGLALPVYSGVGPTEIRGLYQVGPVLLVFHRDGTSYINGFGQSDLIVATGATGVSRSVGILNIHTAQDIGSGRAIWLSGRGFELYNGAVIERISSPQLDKILDEEALQLIEAAGPASSRNTSIFLTDLHQYWCTVQVRTNRHVLVKYDLRTQGFGVHEFRFRTTEISGNNLGSLVAAPSTQIVDQARTRAESFSTDGFYRQLNFGDLDDTESDNSLGEPIQLEATTRPFIWIDLHHRKRARQLRVSAETLQPEALVEVAAIVDGLPVGGRDTLANPGFEAGLDDWTFIGGGGAWTTGTLPRFGLLSLRFDPLGQSTTASARALNASDDIVEGDAWEFSVWVLAEVTGQTVRAGVRFPGGSGFPLASSKFTPFEIVGRESSYVRLSAWGTVPAGTTSVQGSIEVLNGDLGIVWFDDARLRRLRRHTLAVLTGNGDIPRQPLKARVNGRGRVHQVGIYTTDRVEIVAVEERAEMLREP